MIEVFAGSTVLQAWRLRLLLTKSRRNPQEAPFFSWTVEQQKQRPFVPMDAIPNAAVGALGTCMRHCKQSQGYPSVC